MHTINTQQAINLKVVRFELDFTPLIEAERTSRKKTKKITVSGVNNVVRAKSSVPPPPPIRKRVQKRDVKELVEELLEELYSDQRDWSNTSAIDCRGSTSAVSVTSSQSNCGDHKDAIERSYLELLSIEEIRAQCCEWQERLQWMGERLARSLRARDRLKRQQKRLCAAFTVLLRRISGESGARFGVTPGGEGPGEGGFSEWLHAMRLVARLPAGVPQHFRKKLWITLAERYLTSRGMDWPAAERACFRGSAQPDDTELGAQIIKDLHRTGCSLFCGTEGRENQAMLRRVLLAYARWNKDVGYCQGFNMLAAIILEVMEKSESDSLKVMIYLVEAVLPEGYFADDLRGLSADMAAFRDLLRLRLPRLATHMDHLQKISDGGGVEPPLPDVFTMQWFLTLYATWLPRDSLLRIWDLILLDGNEVLLLTALAIWDLLQDRILSARSADEFYSCMGGGSGVIWEAGESLVARVVAFGSAPELPRLRSLHRYRVTPPATATPPVHSAMQSMTKRGLRLFYSEDEGDSSDDGNKMALATVIPRREERVVGAGDRLSLDIGALKRQYARLRERQRQAHVILAAACARHAAVGVPTSPTSLTVNNLLLGKSAIVSSRGRRLGPPPGAVPPTRRNSSPRDNLEKRSHGRSNETISWNEEKSKKSLSRRNSMKWKDINKEKASEKIRKASIDLDEAGDGVIVSELEASRMIASLRSRSSSETSSYSSHAASSTDTSLCDENEKASDSEAELPDDDKGKTNVKSKDIIPSPLYQESTVLSNTLMGDENNCVDNISDYLDSAAGEPLRTYIDGFETKLKQALDVSQDFEIRPSSPVQKLSSLISSPLHSNKDNILQRLSSKKYEEKEKSEDTLRPVSFTLTPKCLTDISPLDLTLGCIKHDIGVESTYSYNLESNFRTSPESSRPPDIIDSFVKYPNFVPDIELTDKNVSDIDSPSRSPGAESIIVSEDEPPIPLKIDKYFEHSPEFFGARITDANNTDIPNRRAVKRHSRLPKKPDSLTLHTSHNEKILKEEAERASSLPQSHSFTSNKSLSPESTARLTDDEQLFTRHSSNAIQTPMEPTVETISTSPQDYIRESGRKNSERALQIIQENSKILRRILTKQHIIDTKSVVADSIEHNENANLCTTEKLLENRQMASPLLKESISDSLIGYKKRNINEDNMERDQFVRVRPISIDDPISLESHSNISKDNEFLVKIANKSPSTESLGNKTDLYGWENKGFLAKCELKGYLDNSVHKYKRTDSNILKSDCIKSEVKPVVSTESSLNSYTVDSKTHPCIEHKNLNDKPYSSEKQYFQFSNKFEYNDFVLSKASDICSKTVDQGPKACENLLKTDNSQFSDFAHVVTSSISFSYEPSAEDDSPSGIKSNSSDTLCQITSLDQVSTPISPKIFPKETTTFPKDYVDKSDKTIVETDDTCSNITSLIETTDTLSSLSYPRSPSSGSFYPFPTKPTMRMPKELGVRLGMYPKDTINSSPK